MFIVTWAAILVWHFGHIEEKWTARLHADGSQPTSSELA
jgi:hypothetical protein